MSTVFLELEDAVNSKVKLTLENGKIFIYDEEAKSGMKFWFKPGDVEKLSDHLGILKQGESKR